MPEEKKPDVVPVVAATAPMPVEEPKSTPRVVFTPKEIKLGEEVKFEHDSDRLTKSGRDLLDEVARVIKQNRKSYLKILIEGHTNELGTYPYNQTLSENRANSVREYLTSRGIKGKELMAIGYGKTKPKRVRGRLSRDAKLAANRRVVFRVIN